MSGIDIEAEVKQVRVALENTMELVRKAVNNHYDSFFFSHYEHIGEKLIEATAYLQLMEMEIQRQKVTDEWIKESND